jgi:hypothetical protein
MRIWVVVCWGFVAPALAFAQNAESCSAAEHRQFDFWLGDWDVRNAAGELLGHNEIRRVAGGCALLESWRGARGNDGISINAYDGNEWTQRWAGAGAMLWLKGGLDAHGHMVLTATAPRNTLRGAVIDRITWSPLDDGRIRQAWDVSADEGVTWQQIFEGFYSARESQDP